MDDTDCYRDFLLRVVPPPPSTPCPGGVRLRRGSPAWVARQARVAALQEHYATGAGFVEAEAEAWAEVTDPGPFSKAGVQLAAQGLGWRVGRLLAAFATQGRVLPPHLRAWAANHVTRYHRRFGP